MLGGLSLLHCLTAGSNCCIWSCYPCHVIALSPLLVLSDIVLGLLQLLLQLLLPLLLLLRVLLLVLLLQLFLLLLPHLLW